MCGRSSQALLFVTFYGTRDLSEWLRNDGHETDASVGELLAGYAGILVELRRRGVIRSANAPAGDYAEWLCATALGGKLVDNFSVKSHDLTLPDGRLVQVKARVTSDPPSAVAAAVGTDL